MWPLTVAAKGDRPGRGLFPPISSSWDLDWGQGGSFITLWSRGYLVAEQWVEEGPVEKVKMGGAGSLAQFDE